MPQTLTETEHALNFLASEAPGYRSRAVVTIEANQDLSPGHVLGKVTGSSISATADADNTGDGTISGLAVTSGSKPGDYRAVNVAALTDGGTFNIFDPEGVYIDSVSVGSAFSGGGIEFTINDGATDFAIGDAFTITVSGTGEYKEYDPTSTDGSDRAEAILMYPADTTDGSAMTVAAIVRDAEYMPGELTWFANATAAQMTTGQNQLAEQGLIAR